METPNGYTMALDIMKMQHDHTLDFLLAYAITGNRSKAQRIVWLLETYSQPQLAAIVANVK